MRISSNWMRCGENLKTSDLCLIVSVVNIVKAVFKNMLTSARKTVFSFWMALRRPMLLWDHRLWCWRLFPHWIRLITWYWEKNHRKLCICNHSLSMWDFFVFSKFKFGLCLDLCVSSLRRSHTNFLCIIETFSMVSYVNEKRKNKVRLLL